MGGHLWSRVGWLRGNERPSVSAHLAPQGLGLVPGSPAPPETTAAEGSGGARSWGEWVLGGEGFSQQRRLSAYRLHRMDPRHPGAEAAWPFTPAPKVPRAETGSET